MPNKPIGNNKIHCGNLINVLKLKKNQPTAIKTSENMMKLKEMPNTTY